ncbi:predicted protein [Histoplasma capsulatum var. duboisii H88]|uniref:Predicted protein n=2 Tax=Ajellomyces capsulatus TaxID=5037 RepID=F0UNL9_AJEC8|nr:predicted protein [Histoplasma capsulatum H143]EGC47624.1 predicted protein [Histoplasma capsulatum var. duboisii H88]
MEHRRETIVSIRLGSRKGRPEGISRRIRPCKRWGMATFYTDVTLWRQMGRPHSHTRPRHEPGQLHPQGERRDSKNGGPAGEKRRGHGKELVREEERRDSEGEVEDVAVGACSLRAECLSGSLTTQLEGSDRRNVHGHGRAASRHA